MHKGELGAFQISRSIYDSEIWNKPADWLKIWIYILGNVYYADYGNFKRGQNFFRYDTIANNCQVKYNSVAKCMVYLRSARQIEIEKTTRGALVSVINFDKYQDLRSYGKTEAIEKRLKSDTIIKENKKERNINKEDIYRDFAHLKITNDEFNSLLENYSKEKIDDKFMTLTVFDKDWNIFLIEDLSSKNFNVQKEFKDLFDGLKLQEQSFIKLKKYMKDTLVELHESQTKTK